MNQWTAQRWRTSDSGDDDDAGEIDDSVPVVTATMTLTTMTIVSTRLDAMTASAR
jgi:hypothetical protein